MCVEVSESAVATDAVVECVVNFSAMYQREELKNATELFLSRRFLLWLKVGLCSISLKGAVTQPGLRCLDLLTVISLLTSSLCLLSLG